MLLTPTSEYFSNKSDYNLKYQPAIKLEEIMMFSLEIH